MPASAIGNNTKTGRLSVVRASRTPSQANHFVRRSWKARTATHIETTNQKVVQTSVITSAPKYGIGGKIATSAAPPSATGSGATRRPIANTTRHIATKASVCAKATGHWVAPNTRAALVTLAEQDGPLDLRGGDRDAEARGGALLSLIVATREFQFV